MTDYMKRSLEARGSLLLIILEGKFRNSANDFNEHLIRDEPLLHAREFLQFNQVVFDLSGVEQMSSSGIGILVVLMKMFQAAGHTEPIVIIGASAQIKRVLRTAQLSSMFRHFRKLDHIPEVMQ
ncbi:STAS domain-containing protein [Patescibacteria group bacterium]|nr:STAS domain-containing protein [Patescibacteria group bacterium]MBU1075566.1 STAS domain-containing protein [Patescibacteria group bacterium]MBU1952062.1 STAS domain-containing protein [Patescibacteria group bacterium]